MFMNQASRSSHYVEEAGTYGVFGKGKYGGLVKPLITQSSAHGAIAAQSFTTIQRTAVIASSRSTTVPPMMPAT